MGRGRGLDLALSHNDQREGIQVPVHVYQPSSAERLTEAIAELERKGHKVLEFKEHAGQWLILTEKKTRTETRARVS